MHLRRSIAGLHKLMILASREGRQNASILQHGQKAIDENIHKVIEKFIDGQSNSEDACHSQLLEAKHQLNQLHDMVVDLIEEVNSTEKAIIVYDKELQEKLKALTV